MFVIQNPVCRELCRGVLKGHGAHPSGDVAGDELTAAVDDAVDLLDDVKEDLVVGVLDVGLPPRDRQHLRNGEGSGLWGWELRDGDGKDSR